MVDPSLPIDLVILLQLLLAAKAGGDSFQNDVKRQLYEECEGKCAICQGEFALRELQVDHRIPYEIAGDAIATELALESY
nr:HNH endonuclease signature motif containing protein [Caldilineaceae bacterium]